MTIEQQIYDGDRAREILENEVFQRVFADIEQELIEQWKSSGSGDQDARERTWQQLTQLRKVQACLQKTLSGGKLALLELENRRKISERLRQRATSWLGVGS